MYIKDSGINEFFVGFPYDNIGWAQNNDKLIIGKTMNIGDALMTIKNTDLGSALCFGFCSGDFSLLF